MFLIKSTVKAAAALAFAVGIACGAHAARTVCVSEQTDSAVTLAFGGVDELDYELFLAHGATDGGDDKAKWDSFEKIAKLLPTDPVRLMFLRASDPPPVSVR